MGMHRFSGGMDPGAQYDEVLTSAEGPTAVKINGRWGYMGDDGRWVIELALSEALPFFNGLAWIGLREDGDYRSYAIDQTGDRIFQSSYGSGMPFSEGFSAHVVGGYPHIRSSTTYINKQGEVNSWSVRWSRANHSRRDLPGFGAAKAKAA